MPQPIFDRTQKKRERVDNATLEALEGGTARLAKSFQKGDIVRYTAKWLRNVGLHSGGPKNGEVQGTSGSFVSVLWSDASEPVFVHPANIELDPRHKKQAYSYDRRR